MDDPYRAALALAAMRRPNHRTAPSEHPTPTLADHDPIAAPPTVAQATATHPSRRVATDTAAADAATAHPADVPPNAERPAVRDAPAGDVTDPLLWRDAQHVLHTHAGAGGRCRQCGQPWPCPASRAARRADTLARRPRPAIDAVDAAPLPHDAGRNPNLGGCDGARYPQRALSPGTAPDGSGRSPRTRYVGWWG